MTAKQHSSKHDCSPGDIPPFCRNNYFTGKLLTERDFTAEQRYMVDKLRLHHVALHGWGVVCGLKVTPHPKSPNLKLIVESGIAVDGMGHEIRVPAPVECELPSLQPTPSEADQWTPEPDSHSDVPAQQSSHPVTVTLYVYLRYVEREAELMATPFSEFGTGSNAKKPNRIYESYQLEIATDEPASFQLIGKEKTKDDAQSYHEIYRTASRAPARSLTLTASLWPLSIVLPSVRL
jgi:hypothetical protein